MRAILRFYPLDAASGAKLRRQVIGAVASRLWSDLTKNYLFVSVGYSHDQFERGEELTELIVVVGGWDVPGYGEQPTLAHQIVTATESLRWFGLQIVIEKKTVDRLMVPPLQQALTATPVR